MAEDGKIYITISDKRNGDGGGGGVGTPDDGSKEKDKVSLKTFAVNQLASSVKQNALKIANATVSNIGNFTGDYTMQRNISEAVRLGKVGMSLGESFVFGTIATGNPLGGLVMVGVNAIGMGIEYGIQEYQDTFNNKKLNYDVEQLRKISGLNSLRDGSRGTEN